MKVKTVLVVTLVALTTSRLAAQSEALAPALGEQLRAALAAARPTGGAGEKFCLCHQTSEVICLNCRFGVAAAWQNPFDGSTGIAGAKFLTTESGYLWFTDPLNMEVPIKILDGCGSGPPTDTWWVFAAGLTNLGVIIDVEDFSTGTIQEYVNPPGQLFNTIIDQQTPFPCP
jgi:hypothetical protein